MPLEKDCFVAVHVEVGTKFGTRTTIRKIRKLVKHFGGSRQMKNCLLRPDGSTPNHGPGWHGVRLDEITHRGRMSPTLEKDERVLWHDACQSTKKGRVVDLPVNLPARTRHVDPVPLFQRDSIHETQEPV